MQDQEWLTLREAADALGISEVSARRWVKSGKLKAAQPGRKYLIPRSAVEELLNPKAPAPSAGQLSPERRAELAQWWQTVRSGAMPLEEWSDDELVLAKQALERAERGEPAIASGIFDIEESPEQARLDAEAMRLLLQREERRREVARGA